jgi:predicted small metal-binding protein
MSETYEDCIQLFCVRCGDVGLDCNYTIYGISEETVIDNTILHMFENHAIEPEGMTTCMRLKIMENIHAIHSPPI